MRGAEPVGSGVIRAGENGGGEGGGQQGAIVGGVREAVGRVAAEDGKQWSGRQAWRSSVLASAALLGTCRDECLRTVR